MIHPDNLTNKIIIIKKQGKQKRKTNGDKNDEGKTKVEQLH